MITGVIKNAKKIHNTRVSVNPVSHHYEETGEKPYIKYSCPVCEAVGVKAQITAGRKLCPLCGVFLNWDRKPEIGDKVIVRSMINSDFIEGDLCTITEDHSNEPGELPYVLKLTDGKYFKSKQPEKYVRCHADDFTILEELEEEL